MAKLIDAASAISCKRVEVNIRDEVNLTWKSGYQTANLDGKLVERLKLEWRSAERMTVHARRSRECQHNT